MGNEAERASRGHRLGRSTAIAVVGVLSLVGVAVLVLWASHWLPTVRAECRVSVLMFHSVVPDSLAPSRYAMTRSEFAAQMDELRDHQIAATDLDELLEFMDSRGDAPAPGCPYPDGAVLITFDMDGPSFHAETVPDILVARSQPAVFFVPTGYIDQGRAVSSDAIRALSAQGFEFGSHSEWHRDMRHVEATELQESLGRSRATLEGLTGRPVRSIAAPGGRYDEDVISLVQATGFDAFFNSDPCMITGARSPFEVCRIEIRGDRGLRAAQAVTSPARVATQATGWDLKRGFERVIGDRGWSWIRGIREAY